MSVGKKVGRGSVDRKNPTIRGHYLEIKAWVLGSICAQYFRMNIYFYFTIV